MEAQVLPTDLKVALIHDLADAGIPAIQVASFVHPKRMPQMADAEEVVQRLDRYDSVQFSGLTLNKRGMERALKTSVPWIEVSLSVHDGHSQRNAGMTTAQARIEIAGMVALARQAGRKVRVTIQCAFGCADATDVTVDQVKEMAVFLIDQGVDLLVPADTTGMASPVTIERVVRAVLSVAGNLPVGLHLHDTRGLGLANVLTALKLGISHFDTSLGGLGGCPVVPGAAGNIATEDTVHLMNSMGVETGIDINQVAACSQRLSDFFARPLAGKMYKLAPPQQ
jgi:hydroxymethylglutaryl-CoA lyase